MLDQLVAYISHVWEQEPLLLIVIVFLALLCLNYAMVYLRLRMMLNSGL